MKYFILERFEDATGISGIGIVVEGIIWSDGTVAYRWLSDIATTIIADSIEDVMVLHGHDGRTKIKYVHTLPDYPKYEANKQSPKEEKPILEKVEGRK